MLLSTPTKTSQDSGCGPGGTCSSGEERVKTNPRKMHQFVANWPQRNQAFREAFIWITKYFCRTLWRSDHEVRLSRPPPTTHPPPTTLSSEIESCTSYSLTPPNPYIFWKLMSRAIQKRQRDTNTKTMTITNTKTKTKTRTPRQYLEHLQCAIFSESWWLAQSSPALPSTV